MFQTLLVANRGEIAGRIIRTARRLGIDTVAVHSAPDRFTAPVMAADRAVAIGAGPAKESYLDVERVVRAAVESGAEAVHPGYGFLSENAGFARALAAAGVRFVGPRPEHLEAFGLKHTARDAAIAAGLALLPGSGLLASAEAAVAEAERIGFPVMLKASAGGGGIGMRLCRDADALAEGFAAVMRMATSSFGDARVYLERFVGRARHVEVQVFGDGRGGVVHLGERDCSLQRRNQKVVEETPAPGLPAAVREEILGSAVALARSVAYESAGTVEFVYDVERAQAYFLEVNTRLQVEHPVTEACYGVDLVEWMIRQAAGEFALPDQASLVASGAAIEVRLYAENPALGFRPSTGRVTRLAWPAGVRIDGWIEPGTEVTAFYDPMLAKVIAHGPDRAAALATLADALDATAVDGLETNLAYLRAVVRSEVMAKGEGVTATLADFPFRPATVDVLDGGTQTSLQDWPGRLGLWSVGVPPSGPFDDYSFRAANLLVGNDAGVAALECTFQGPSLRFNAGAVIALAGAETSASIDGKPVRHHTRVTVAAGQVLSVGRVTGAGLRTYLAVAGGFAAPEVLGARATFTLGGFGGVTGRALKAGDTLHLADPRAGEASALTTGLAPRPAAITRDWTICVLYGPHGAPDFFDPDDVATLFAATYTVHFNSARTGIRLVGPKPRWARADGGEAGLHPSNIHDTAYAVGSIDFTGDMPIILGPDGPSLGGFVCPAVVARDEMWKLGQLATGDRVRFVPARRPADDALAAPAIPAARADLGPAVLARSEAGAVPITIRRAGDDAVLVEYGAMTLDLGLRMRVHLMMQALEGARLAAVTDLTPGIRSLQIRYDGSKLARAKLLGLLAEIEASLPAIEDVTVPSRVVHLPLSWSDPSVVLAMRKYQELVRPDAPWCPSNIEFIRRINGLADEQAVRDIVFAADYLVMGLGDVYLGAPVATPLDPRHRLVTTKYNPARTWTPENAVGIGGAYLCVYGMEGPGGYQLFGRTVQMWNGLAALDPGRRRGAFEPGSPWLLRFFDRIRFFPVAEEELQEARAAFPHGRYDLRIEEGSLAWRDHARFLADNAGGIAAFEAHRSAAFAEERERWRLAGLDVPPTDDGGIAPAADIPDGAFAVTSEITGNVWQIAAAPGDRLAAGDPVVVLESMKMEMAVAAPRAGVVREIRCRPGQTVSAGDIVAILAES